ncbi:hypothetical protein [Maledivibacter halophilus]|uniref:Uncharacterized protein n=1 Tax=Maledivibacter halophilus TaxID=36842 RepID=A0A1T5LP92_9FIRM|nr:hypothetical protein [Maledivibacter halophilus]SKC77803.1 hypothetical protein SAMN02194393_03186 [Maledivibacter halophilus]
MDAIVDEKIFYESLEQFTAEYREEILKGLKKNNEEYKILRKEFSEILEGTERLSQRLHGEDGNLIDKFIEMYFAIVIIESSQIYLQGQIDGMRIIKKLNHL